MGFKPGPLAPKSNALTTRLCRRKERAILSWLFVPLLWLFLCIWPLRLSVALEVTPDLKFELCGLNNPCFGAFLASKCMKKPFIPRKEGRMKEGQNGHVDLHASPQVKRSSLRKTWRVYKSGPRFREYEEKKITPKLS